MDTLPTTSFVLLGLLARQPQSGYDLSALIERKIAHIWPLTRSLIYRELRRLEDLDLVAARRVVQDYRPDKRIYQVTPAGRLQFEAWLSAPGFERDRPRNGLLVKLFFGAQMEPRALATLLADARDEIERRERDMAATVERLSGAEDSRRYRWATALYAMRRAQAELAWLDDLTAAMSPACVPDADASD